VPLMDWGSEGRRQAKQWTRDRYHEVGRVKNMTLALLTRTRRTESKTS
jgi:hypothetical protein